MNVSTLVLAQFAFIIFYIISANNTGKLDNACVPTICELPWQNVYDNMCYSNTFTLIYMYLYQRYAFRLIGTVYFVQTSLYTNRRLIRNILQPQIPDTRHISVCINWAVDNPTVCAMWYKPNFSLQKQPTLSEKISYLNIIPFRSIHVENC